MYITIFLNFEISIITGFRAYNARIARKAAAQPRTAERNRFFVNHAVTREAAKAAAPHHGFSEIARIAGKVMTESVAYGR